MTTKKYRRAIRQVLEAPEPIQEVMLDVAIETLPEVILADIPKEVSKPSIHHYEDRPWEMPVRSDKEVHDNPWVMSNHQEDPRKVENIVESVEAHKINAGDKIEVKERVEVSVEDKELTGLVCLGIVVALAAALLIVSSL